MKRVIIVLACSFLTLSALADHPATVITVFDAATYRNMVGDKSAKAISERELFSKTLLRGSYFPAKGDHVTATFEYKKTQYQLLISRSDTRTIYSIAEDGTTPRVIAVGEITKGEQSKRDPTGDPFVVVIRGGNYLRK